MKQKRGMGKKQLQQKLVAMNSLLEVLSDGKQHKYGELKEKTRLSSATLSKHLKALNRLVKKKVDLESGEYPYPVYYQLNEFAAVFLKQSKLTSLLSEKLRKAMFETKNPILVLDYLNTSMNILVLSVLKAMKEVQKETGSIDKELLEVVFQLRIMPFMDLYWAFISSSEEIWNEVDFSKVGKDQLEKLDCLRLKIETKKE